MSSFRAILIRPNERPAAVTLKRGLEPLQEAVGGMIEALPVPDWRMDNATDRFDLTAYVNEQGKFECVDEEGRVQMNRIATLFMLPNLFAGDFIAGPFLLCGFDAAKGENEDLPEDVYQQFNLEVPRD